ncbi:hypothetical protein [Kordiimonas sp. SCSIO 12610]|uniref:hypothetical protein n=1 Tax=Kordiimonas sp. SCSIO 12610 TaxID=2829597 RepID=UPI00210890CD|nr:hypothetical protein [Kordiimonas sp. SCSIO 12610]UTW54401.1 hypothetical protein KFF44_11305 [Kordiimonas sp. SCSIO 12610]
MENMSLFRYLQESFENHAEYTVEAFSADGVDQFFVHLQGSDVMLLRVTDGDPILIFFWTKRDMHKLREFPGLEQAPYGRMLEEYGKSYHWLYDRTLAIDPTRVHRSELYEALIEIAKTSHMHQLVPRTDDPIIKALIREYCLTEGEWELDQAMAKLVANVDETNLDYTIASIQEIDPWVEEDPDNYLGTIHILLDRLIKDQRCIAQAHVHLVWLRSEYEKLGPKAEVDIWEVDGLLELTAKYRN